LPSLCAGALLATAAIAGCGDDDGDSAASEKVRFAAASEQEHVFIERMGKLLETTSTKKDCAQLEEINARSLTRFPCPPEKGLRESMATFEVVGTEDYGTGAVVDYKSGNAKDGASIVLFVAPDRSWGIGRFGIVTDPSTGTSDEDSRDGYDEAVELYLDAVRERDCKAFKEVAFITDKKDVCKTSFAGTEPLAKRLKADPSAEPSYEGGNETYGFFTLETRKPVPENVTISVIRAGAGEGETYLILDVAPSPTSDEQRRIQQQYKQQLKEERKKETQPMKPSSKSKPVES
jgi:hypothetical protein